MRDRRCYASKLRSCKLLKSVKNLTSIFARFAYLWCYWLDLKSFKKNVNTMKIIMWFTIAKLCWDSWGLSLKSSKKKRLTWYYYTMSKCDRSRVKVRNRNGIRGTLNNLKQGKTGLQILSLRKSWCYVKNLIATLRCIKNKNLSRYNNLSELFPKFI